MAAGAHVFPRGHRAGASDSEEVCATAGRTGIRSKSADSDADAGATTAHSAARETASLAKPAIGHVFKDASHRAAEIRIELSPSVRTDSSFAGT